MTLHALALSSMCMDTPAHLVSLSEAGSDVCMNEVYQCHTVQLTLQEHVYTAQ